MTNNDLEILIEKYLAGSCSQDECEILLQELRKSSHGRIHLARCAFHERTIIQSLNLNIDQSTPGKLQLKTHDQHNQLDAKRQILGLPKVFWVVSSAVASVLLIVFLFGGINNKTGQLARVIVMKDAVIVRNGNRITASENLILKPQDILSVQPDGECVFQFDGENTKMTVTGMTSLRLDYVENAKSIALDVGSLHATVAKQPKGSPLRVTTPDGVATVVGTIFTLNTTPKGTRLEVTEGCVEFSSVTIRQSVEVNAGFFTIAGKGQALVASHLEAPIPFRIRDFTLVNADTGQPISSFDPIPKNATLDLSKLPTRNLSIRANCEPTVVPSVQFHYDGKARPYPGNSPPYSAFGDEEGTYHPWTPTPGEHTVSAKPYTKANNEGEGGQTVTLVFTVVP